MSIVLAPLAALILTTTPDDTWVSLFDGKTLDGWTQLNGTAKYAVVDGTIEGTTVKGSPNSFLCSDRFYGDFELEYEVKLHDNGLNSGVQIRSQSYPSYKSGRVHGYQVEIATNGTSGYIYDEARRGWLSKDRKNAEANAAFKKGEWNRYRVVCDGDSLKTWVNDVPVANVKDSLTASGFIGLQVHSVGGDPKWRVAWRNIRVKELGDGGGWSSLFDGKTLEGWTANENKGSCKVEDGAIVVGGKRCHLFYTGPVYSHSFKNFEFKAEVMTEPKANSGIYFHTTLQDSGWPSVGYEVQVNNSQGDWRRTAGLYGVEDIREPPAEDGKWFEVTIRVEGQRITTAVDGKVLVDYTEPPNPERRDDMKKRLLNRGTFALQAHDPGSIVHYRNLRVKVLPE